MRIGVIYPQTELPTDPETVRAYARRVEELGYRHFEIYDHVLGADPAVHAGWNGPYDVDTTFHEPLVFYGFLAAITELELVTGIVVAPQRQTALLAKQAAEVDVLSGGRFRLGIAVGWNPVEYEGLGQTFSTRGQREEEQIGLLRRLWAERSVTHNGRFDRIIGAGLAPAPIQRPIPIWLGGLSPVAYRRMGRLADGWFPRVEPGPELEEACAIIAEGATEAGRDPAAIGMQPRVSWGAGDTDVLITNADRWRDAGATHLSVDTMGSGLTGLDAHLDALARASEALQLAGLPSRSRRRRLPDVRQFDCPLADASGGPHERHSPHARGGSHMSAETRPGTIGIIGAGHIGQAFARVAQRGGREVLIANSRGPESLSPAVAALGEGVSAGTVAEAAASALVVIAVPWASVPAAVGGLVWNGQIVIDATNAWVFPDTPDMRPAELDGRSSSEIVAELVAGARVVKAANTLPAELLGADPRDAGGRRVLFLSGDDAAAKAEVAELFEATGFFPIDLGDLVTGGRLQQATGGPLAALNLVRLP